MNRIPQFVRLRAQNLRKTFGEVVAVDGIDLEITAGECFGLLGPNGAGKTTTLEIFEGLIEPDSGELEILGLRWKESPQQLRNRLGVQLQETQLSERLTVQETIRLFRSFYPTGPSTAKLLLLAILDDKQNTRVGDLSGGQRQRLGLACALAGDPDLLFLDEPTTGLDPLARRQLWDVITRFKSDGRTIILTTHYMEEAERLCDRIAVMDRGKIIARGTPRELIDSIPARNIVELSVQDQTIRPDLEPLRRLPGIQDVQMSDCEIRMVAVDLHDAVPALLDELSRQGIRPSALLTRSPTLEDVFVALTGRRLRDD